MNRRIEIGIVLILVLIGGLFLDVECRASMVEESDTLSIVEGNDTLSISENMSKSVEDIIAEIETTEVSNINIKLSVSDISLFSDTIYAIVERYQGAIEEESSTIEQDKKAMNIQMISPSKSKMEIVEQIRGAGYEVYEQKVETRDVTATYNTILTSVSITESYLSRYRVLQKEVYTMEEILTLEKSIRELEAALNRDKLKLLTLKSDIDYCNFNLEIVEHSGAISSGAGYWDSILDSLKIGVSRLGSMGLFLVANWYLLLLLPLLLLRRKRRR